MKQLAIAFSAFILSTILILSNVQISDSTLYYQLIVTTKPEKNPIMPKEYPVIIGSVTNEAGKPVSNANVLIMFGTQTVLTTTDTQGNYRYQSAIPATSGWYQINVIATKSGYVKGLASSTYFVNSPPTVTYTRTITGLPITINDYTVYLGKVTQWNLETTCFVSFGDKYMRFLKTCDLYNLEPQDFQSSNQVISVVTVIQHNDAYRLFSHGIYTKVANLDNQTLAKFVKGTWDNYTDPSHS